MEICTLIIPKKLQTNPFIVSLHKQYTQKGKLTINQLWALEDMLEIRLDFFEWDFKLDPESVDYIEMKENWDQLIAKLNRDRFRKNKNRNKCVRALMSIVEGQPKCGLIDEALGRGFNPYYRYERRKWRY